MLILLIDVIEPAGTCINVDLELLELALHLDLLLQLFDLSHLLIDLELLIVDRHLQHAHLDLLLC